MIEDDLKKAGFKKTGCDNVHTLEYWNKDGEEILCAVNEDGTRSCYGRVSPRFEGLI